MRLKVTEVIVKGEGKPVIRPNTGAPVVDEAGEPVLKHKIVGYQITDLDGEVGERKVHREEAGDYVFNLLNHDVLVKINEKKARGEQVTDDDLAELKYEIENAVINMRENTRTDGKKDVTTYLKARQGVIRSLEIPELVVNFLDGQGNCKQGYEMFEELKPKKKSAAGDTRRKAGTRQRRAVSEEMTRMSMARYAQALSQRSIDVIQPLMPTVKE